MACKPFLFAALNTRPDSNFVKHLFAQEDFWVLLAILCCFRSFRRRWKLAGIEFPTQHFYLGNKPIRSVPNEGQAPAVSSTSLEAMRPVKRLPAPIRCCLTSPNQPGGSTRDSAGSTSDFSAAISDSLRPLAECIQRHDTRVIFPFTIHFVQITSGGYKEWVSEKIAALKQVTGRCKHFASTACG